MKAPSPPAVGGAGRAWGPPTLRGERLVLRALREADREQRLANGRDPVFHRLVGGDPTRSQLPLTREDVERWYARHAGEPYFWVIELDGRMIGTAWLHSLEPRHRSARYAIGIFAPEHRGRGYGREATDLVLGYVFTTLRLARVELCVLEFNTAAIRMYERCGFVREPGDPERVLIGGVWQAELPMAAVAPPTP